jgi:signal transduction histidine kinase
MIAHQWRQPLNVLSMLNQSIVIKYNRDKLDKEFIKYFQETSTRQIKNMSQTIDDFRSFFRPDKQDTRFSINEVIKNMLNIIGPLFIKNSIEIELDEKEECFAKGHPNEIGQAVINIINNAKDALIENDIKHKYIKITIECEGEEILLSIKDNGGGIPKDIIETIFDPYFTTKDEKNGTGLGLYMSKIIIEKHEGGNISVVNDEDGAVFKIRLKKD